MKKFLHSDWLRAVQFLVNTVPKKKFSAKKGNSVPISLDFKFLNFLRLMYIYSIGRMICHREYISNFEKTLQFLFLLNRVFCHCSSQFIIITTVAQTHGFLPRTRCNFFTFSSLRFLKPLQVGVHALHFLIVLLYRTTFN